MKNEAVVQSEVRKRAGELGIHLFRNNVGAMEDVKTGRVVRFGLANESAAQSKRLKSSDLIGWACGRFLSVECKHEGWKIGRKPSEREEAQLRWITLVIQYGGIAGFVTCVEDFDKLVLPCFQA